MGSSGVPAQEQGEGGRRPTEGQVQTDFASKGCEGIWAEEQSTACREQEKGGEAEAEGSSWRTHKQSRVKAESREHLESTQECRKEAQDGEEEQSTSREEEQGTS